MRKILISTLLLAAVSITSARAQTQTPTQLTEECRSFIAGLPQNTQSGFVTVPENWAKPDQGPQLSIFYYGVNLNEVIASGATPIVYFNGGPGFSTHSASIYFRTFAQAQAIPFLYIDQRGTGCSGEYPVVPATREGAEKLALYGTRNIVLDAEAIRKSIFPDHRKWSLFGQSFGTAIVHRYIAIAPEAVKKAYAHGLSMMTDGVGWVEDRVLSQKRVAALYLAQYPDDEKILSHARAIFPADYCTGNQMMKTCGAGVLDFLPASIGFSNAWPRVHAILFQILKPNQDLDFSIIEKVIPRGVSEDPGMRDLMAASVATRELPGGLLENWSCKQATRRLLASGEHPESWFYNECRVAAATSSPSDPFIKELIAEDYLTISSLAQSLRKYPDLELHLYSGELDTFSPREGCEEVVRRLGKRIAYTNFPKTGHDWISEAQIWDDLKK